MFRTTYLLLCSLCILIPLVLSGCGIKPSDVTLPEDQNSKPFPRVYPDPQKNLP